jgi:putative spermidine/putrescine transport system ATP-binding protein
MATLTLDNLSKHFGTVRAVDGISFEAKDGEFICILGPSGCGKSTALRMIAGFEEPTDGDIRIDGETMTHRPPNRRPTAMVFQKYTLWPHMTVFDNIAFGLKLRGLSRKEIQKTVLEGLDLVSLAGYESRFPAQLSGGQQQRIALARALVLEPKILLLDEPFSSLDALLRVRLREELRRIQRRLGITTIFVTHDQEEALSLADRIAVMNTGKIEQMDGPSTIYAYPMTLFAADFIGAMNLIRATVTNGEADVLGINLRVEDALVEGEKVQIGIRPEDFAIVPDGTVTPTVALWTATIDQIMDMGHYRKVLVQVRTAKAEPLKVYANKTIQLIEGDTIQIAPLRYLVYSDGQAPTEMQQHIQAELLTLN